MEGGGVDGCPKRITDTAFVYIQYPVINHNGKECEKEYI